MAKKKPPKEKQISDKDLKNVKGDKDLGRPASGGMISRAGCGCSSMPSDPVGS